MNETSHAIVKNDHNTDIVLRVNGDHMVDEKDGSDDDEEDDDDDSSMCVWRVQERLSAPFTYMYSSTIYRGPRLLPCHSLPHLPYLLVNILLIILLLLIIIT